MIAATVAGHHTRQAVKKRVARSVAGPRKTRWSCADRDLGKA